MLTRYTWKTAVREVLLLAMALVFTVPLLLLISISLKTASDAFNHPLSLPVDLEILNYRDAWRGGDTSLRGPMTNSIVITTAAVLSLIALGAPCAWAIARRTSNMSTITYLIFIVAMILPFKLSIIPIYVAARHLHLLGTVQGMVLIDVSLYLPLTVFLYTGFIRALPIEYEEAAHIDGASRFYTFVRVVFPLLAPVTGTVAVLTGLLIWNDFFLPLLFLSGSSHATLPVAIYAFVGEFTSEWNLIFAAIAMAILPIVVLYLFVQRHLIRGFTGGIRG